MSHSRAHSVSFVDVIKLLPNKSDFDSDVKVLQDRLDGDSQIGIVELDGAIYAAKHIPTPTMQHQLEVLEEWELVRDLKLLGYHLLYNDTKNASMIIIQDYLPCNLLQYICTQNKSHKSLKTKRKSSHRNKKRLSSSQTLQEFPHLADLECKNIAMNVLYKLKKMHRHGLIHCDIKLQNVMKLTSLNRNKHNCGDWRLINFAFRCRFNVRKGYCMNSWRGTIGWTAPEMVPNNGRNNRIYPETDVWSMGLVILYMVIGENPFELTVKECKDNKLYTLESGKRYWYYKKLVKFDKKKLSHYLMFLHKKNKISLDLLDLLLNHMLVFDVKKRSNVKTVLKHKWFKKVIKIKRVNSRKTLA